MIRTTGASLLSCSALFATLLAAQSPAPVKTGPAIGSRIPEFAATDQEGSLRSFENLRGEKGLMLVFYRSADW